MEQILESVINGQYKQAAKQTIEQEESSADIVEALYNNGDTISTIKSFLFAYERELKKQK